jgi:hypothetical protein
MKFTRFEWLSVFFALAFATFIGLYALFAE